MSITNCDKEAKWSATREAQFEFKVSETIHEESDNSELETEIECPTCQSIMTLNVYDSPYYGCDECNFCLYI